ncbi:hypothetical protein BD410DRAFT_818808 [Rickenella mellea]|uniref:Non-structural maintenance of chromosomes element 1 homolog n=1 Tax=Rickenella mellea TaxID=50990 RepID=A0A4Y7QI73_9AGAM|nr:hypothetical protein BD410DRAFT_818808 [Rickenella mellea]
MGKDKISSNDVQRLFLQAVISRRYMSEKLAKTLHRKCVDTVKFAGGLNIPYEDTVGFWDDFITKVNRSLDPLDLEFKNVVDEVKGRKHYVLVNTKGDEIAQMATDYTPAEIAFFKAVVEQIMLSPNLAFSLSSLAALREVSTLKSTMTKTQAEVVLSSFVAKGWLLKSKKGRFSLSARTIVELEPYLRSSYNEELLDCTICSEVVTKGITCVGTNCHTYIHMHCYAVYKRTKSSCPTCRTEWGNGSSLPPIGEDAAKPGQDHQRRVRRRSGADGDEDEDEMDPSQSQSQSQDPSQEPSQTQTQKKGKKKAAAKGSKKTNGRAAREETPESEEDNDDEELSQNIEGMDIDNLTQDKGRSRRKR